MFQTFYFFMISVTVTRIVQEGTTVAGVQGGQEAIQSREAGES